MSIWIPFVTLDAGKQLHSVFGVGEGVVNKLVNAGYEEVKTILELTPDVIARIDGFQLKSATNVYNSIHKVIDSPQPLERVMMASNVFGLGLGEKKFKMILNSISHFFKTWQKGKITKEDVKKYLDTLPDETKNAVPLDHEEVKNIQ